MAQTNSIYNQPLSGNLGSQTYKNYGGKQVITARFYTTSAKGEGASRAQRDTRMLLPNLTLIGSRLKEWLPVLWEDNRFFKRPYTNFIGKNVKLKIPVLPKEMTDQGLCALGNLQISGGSLPSVYYALQTNSDFLTDIRINPDLDVNSATVSAFSRSIINGNTGYKDGDFLVIVRAVYSRYTLSSTLNSAYCNLLVSAVQLDTKNTGLLIGAYKGDYVHFQFLTSDMYGKVLGFHASSIAQNAVIHVRKFRGRYLCSTQSMASTHGHTQWIDDMFTPEYLDYCAASWGYKDRIL